MKKILVFLLGASLFVGLEKGKFDSVNTYTKSNEIAYQEAFEDVALTTMATNSLNIEGKSGFLMDFNTQTVMYAHKETERLPIASMCKIMTLLLCFEAEAEGVFKMTDKVQISQNAASMGGSQVFLEANTSYPVEELIKSIIVCSANDSCVAMAEKIAGSESAFVDKMNEKAKNLGAENTLFANCTGLPKQTQYSCAKDVAIMLKNLLSYEKYYEFSKVWTNKFNHTNGRYTEITNTNKLVRYYDGCDGGKTGFTNEAGFCLAATAKRNDMRIISVVIGAESSDKRFNAVRTMFDFAFSNYAMKPILEKESPLSQQAKVKGGKENCVSVYPEKTLYLCLKRNEQAKFSTEISLKTLKAPIKENDCVGEIVLYKNGVEIDKTKLLATNQVKKANIFDSFKSIARNWNKR